MAVVNIPRDVKDEFYRYKMPVLVAKLEGRGNGKKTVLSNMADIAKSLERPPSYPTKFFGFELGAITTIETEKDKYMINGHYDQSKLAQVLDIFIEKFILCKKCQRNPETYMVIKGGVIELKCKACGGTSPVDLSHKLCTFILKNPPPEQKKIKRPSKVAEDTAGQAEDKEKKERRERRKKEKEEKEKEAKQDSDDDDVVWYTDTSKEAAAARQKQMLDNTSELAAKLLNTGINDKDQPDPLVTMHEFLAKEKAATPDAIVAQLTKEAETHKLNDEQKGRIAFMSLFDTDVYKQMKTDRFNVLKQVCTTADSQSGVISGLTELGKDAAVLKVVPHVLKYMYDEDLLEEEVIIKWYATKSKGDALKVREAAKVFVEWLQNADEESDEDDEDEDEEDEDDDEEEDEDEDDDEEEDEESEEEPPKKGKAPPPKQTQAKGKPAPAPAKKAAASKKKVESSSESEEEEEKEISLSDL